MKSLGLMDPLRARGIDQLRAKEKVRGRADGVQARGAGCEAAPVKAFLTSMEEGLQVAAAGGDWGTVETLRTEVECSQSITLPLKHHSSLQLERSALGNGIIPSSKGR